MMQPISVQGHSDLVRRLAVSILEGRLAPGSRLPGEESFGVSRTSYREAVRVLGAKGLVASRPRHGTHVRPRQDWHLLDPELLGWQSQNPERMDPHFVRNLMEVRRIIEPPAAKFAAERLTVSQGEVLRSAFADMVSSVANWDAFIAADMRFHAGIFAACGNELLQRMSSTIEAALWSSRMITFRSASAESSLPAHQLILEAILERKPEKAEAAMQSLLDQVNQDAIKAVAVVPPESARSRKK